MEAALRDGAAAFCKVTSALVIRPHGPAVTALSGSRGGGDPWGSSTCWFREPRPCSRPVHPLGGGKTMTALGFSHRLESSIASTRRCKTCSNSLLHSVCIVSDTHRIDPILGENRAFKYEKTILGVQKR